MEKQQLEEILAKHKLWLDEQPGGVRAVLIGNNLSGSDLSRCDLSWSNLREADLSGANLSECDLRGADLRRANLSESNLIGSNLCKSDLSGSIWGGAEEQIRQLCNILPPIDQPVIGWEKCTVYNMGVSAGSCIVKLRIPAGTPRSNATTRKCRAERAEVISISGGATEARRTYGYDKPLLTYRVGETVVCEEWDPDWKNECGNGIYFFLTREEAERLW